MWNATCGASLLPLIPEENKISILIGSVAAEILAGPAQPPEDLMFPSYFKFKTKSLYLCALSSVLALSKMKTSYFYLDKNVKMN